MVKNWISVLLLCILAQAITPIAHSQDRDSLLFKTKPRVTIFIPLYLDSAFSEGKYRYGNTIPNHIINGLEFYNGVKVAADELQAAGIPARITVVDTKDPNYLTALFKDSTFEGMGIVISAAQSAAELKSIADKLRPFKTPLISLLPNDAGVSAYPQMIIANSTLKVHCQQLYRYVQRIHATDNLIMLTSPGASEARLKQYFDESNDGSSSFSLRWKEMALPTDTSDTRLIADLTSRMDSNRINVIIAPTLNGNQAQRIVKTLATFTPTYATVVFGMPTWETLPLTKPEFSGVDVWYGTPFSTTTGNFLLSEDFTTRYKDLTNSKPGDMAYRGYEITLRYVKTLAAYGPKFMEHINDYQFRMFNDFNFQPVSLRDARQVDYLENQKIYFIKKTDGIVKTVQAP